MTSTSLESWAVFNRAAAAQLAAHAEAHRAERAGDAPGDSDSERAGRPPRSERSGNDAPAPKRRLAG